MVSAQYAMITGTRGSVPSVASSGGRCGSTHGSQHTHKTLALWRGVLPHPFDPRGNARADARAVIRRSRPPIPGEGVRLFRAKASTDSEPRRPG